VLIEETATARGSEYRKQNVVVGRQTPELIEVRGGQLFPGDRVVTTGAHELTRFFAPTVFRLSPEARANSGLLVQPVGRHVVEEVVEVDGVVYVPPDRRAIASTQLAGTIDKIHVEPAQAVRAGDVLAEVASLELQPLQAELLRTHAQLEVLRDSLHRLRKLDQVIARQRRWETENLYATMWDRHQHIRSKLETVGLSRDQVGAILADKRFVQTVPLRAPIDGVVVRFDKVLGQAVRAEEPLFEIHDLSQVWVQGHVSQHDLARVRVDAETPQSARVRIVADPTLVMQGRVQRSGRVLNAGDRTLTVWVELDEPPGGLLHNLLARLTLTVGRPAPTLAVPVTAVVHDGPEAYVFVEQVVALPGGKTERRFERRLVETGRADDRHVEIIRGLQGQEQVAVQGTAELQTAYAALR
jgi:RND family efflux transporter MFP subunit